jgi:predicted membrane channel-forming protein YqfA (hemolysin III family)
LFFLYTVSTLYHSLHGKAKQVFRKLDHYSIYFLIAGTYPPFTLVTQRGGWLLMVDLKPLLAALPLAGFGWLLQGMSVYRGLGVLFP